MKRTLLVVVAGCLVGCQMGTGILPAGPNTYTLTKKVAPILGGSMTAQKQALTEANAYCTQQGRQFAPAQMGAAPSANPYGPTDYTVTFRCLLPTDPALANFNLERPPDVIVERRDR